MGEQKTFLQRLKTFGIWVCGIYACLLIFDFAYIRIVGQTPQTTLTVVTYTNVTASSKLDGCSTVDPCIDNRSQFTKQSSQSSFRAVSSGVGSWSVDMQFSDNSPAGPWSSFGSTAQVTQASATGIGYGIGPASITKPYHDYIRFVMTGNVIILNYSGTRQFWWLPSVAALALPLPATQGGTVGAVVVDQLYNTLSAGCTAAHSAGLSLMLTVAWNSQSTESLNCDIVAATGGKIVPAANQTITLSGSFGGSLTQHFDMSASGSVLAATSAAVSQWEAQWFGADNKGVTTANTALQWLVNAVESNKSCGHIPGGTYKLVSAGATIISTGSVCLHGDGQQSTVLVENSSNATTFSSTGTYNHYFSFGISPASGTSGGTAFLDGGGTNSITGNNWYDDIRVQNQQNAGWFKYAIHALTSPNSDDNELRITNSQLVVGTDSSTAAIYLERIHAAHTINAFQISNVNIDGGGPINGILCAGCGEGIIVNVGLFDAANIVFANGNGAASAFGAIYNTLLGISGEYGVPVVILGTLSANNSISLPVADYANIAARVQDNSGGNNFVSIAGGTHQEDMGPSGLGPRFGIGLFQGANGGSQGSTIQSGVQIEIRPDWTGSYTFRYPKLFCASFTNLNTDCNMFSWVPGAGGSGWLFGTAHDFDQPIIATFNGGNNQSLAQIRVQNGGQTDMLLGYQGQQYPLPNYFTMSQLDQNDATVKETHRMLVDGGFQPMITRTVAQLPACGAGTLGREYVVTNSTTQTWGATVTGSGAFVVKVFCNGTNYTIEAK